MNTSAMNSLDLLIPISPAPVKVRTISTVTCYEVSSDISALFFL
jgi:hypothetical protein